MHTSYGNDFDIFIDGEDFFGGFEATDARHFYVHQHYRGFLVPNCLNGFFAVFGFCDDL